MILTPVQAQLILAAAPLAQASDLVTVAFPQTTVKMTPQVIVITQLNGYSKDHECYFAPDAFAKAYDL